MTPNKAAVLCSLASLALWAGAALAHEPATTRYTESTLLKNWALSRCLARAATDEAARDDAHATAAAWLEFGHQPIETYEAIDRLVTDALARPYAGSTPAAYTTMKCIDLFHSRALDRLVRGRPAAPQGRAPRTPPAPADAR